MIPRVGIKLDKEHISPETIKLAFAQPQPSVDRYQVMQEFEELSRTEASNFTSSFFAHRGTGIVWVRCAGRGSLQSAEQFCKELRALPERVEFPRILLDILSLNRVDPLADKHVGETLRHLFPEVDRVAITGNSPLTIMRDLFYRRFIQPGPIREFASVDSAMSWLLE